MSSWINKEGTYKIHFACIMINYGAYIHVKTYFFYHDVDGMLSLKGRGTGVDPSVIDSGMIDGEAVFQGRIPARSTCPALMKRRRKKHTRLKPKERKVRMHWLKSILSWQESLRLKVRPSSCSKHLPGGSFFVG